MQNTNVHVSVRKPSELGGLRRSDREYRAVCIATLLIIPRPRGIILQILAPKAPIASPAGRHRLSSTFFSSSPVAHWNAHCYPSNTFSNVPRHPSSRVPTSALPPTPSAKPCLLTLWRSFTGAVGRVQETENNGGRPVSHGSDRTLRTHRCPPGGGAIDRLHGRCV